MSKALILHLNLLSCKPANGRNYPAFQCILFTSKSLEVSYADSLDPPPSSNSKKQSFLRPDDLHTSALELQILQIENLRIIPMVPQNICISFVWSCFHIIFCKMSCFFKSLWWEPYLWAFPARVYGPKITKTICQVARTFISNDIKNLMNHPLPPPFHSTRSLWTNVNQVLHFLVVQISWNIRGLIQIRMAHTNIRITYATCLLTTWIRDPISFSHT